MLAFFIIFGLNVWLPKQKTDKEQEDSRGKSLIKKIAVKDRKAFETFYYLYAQRIGAYLNKMLHHSDWVDEAVNDVMLTVWQSAERFDPDKGKVTTWLFGIAHNKGLKVLERNTRHRELQLDEAADEFIHDDGEEETAWSDPTQSTQNPEKQIMGQQLGAILESALQQLSDEHRCVIELSFKNNCSYQEIALVMGCPENTVKTRMFHARKRLAQLLTRQGINPEELEQVN